MCFCAPSARLASWLERCVARPVLSPWDLPPPSPPPPSPPANIPPGCPEPTEETPLLPAGQPEPNKETPLLPPSHPQPNEETPLQAPSTPSAAGPEEEGSPDEPLVRMQPWEAEWIVEQHEYRLWCIKQWPPSVAWRQGD